MATAAMGKDKADFREGVWGSNRIVGRKENRIHFSGGVFPKGLQSRTGRGIGSIFVKMKGKVPVYV
jgi:hypothetical protein